MNSKRALTTFLAVTAMASVAFMGCKKDDKKDGSKGAAAGKKTAGTKAEKKGDAPVKKLVAGARAGSPATAITSDVYAMLPKDSNVLFGLNGAKLRSSSLFKQAMPLIAAKAGPDLKKMIDCGIDPITGTGSVVFGMQQESEKGIFRVQGFTQKQFVDCAAKRKAAGDKFNLVTAGDTLTINKDNDKKVTLKWISDDTFIGGPNVDKAAVDAAAAGKDGLDKNAGMMALLKNVDTKAGVFFVVIPDKSKAALPMGAGNMNGVFGSLSFDGGIKVDLGVRMDSPEQAAGAVTKANNMMGMLKTSPYAAYLGKLVLKANNADVVVQLALSTKELDELVAKLKTDPMLGKLLMGGMGGGMGGGGMNPCGGGM